MLQKGEVDIAPTDFTITKGRSTVVDYLPSLSESYNHLFLKNPADALNWGAYITPLTHHCWLGIALFIVIVPPIIAGVLYYGKYPAIYHPCIFLYFRFLLYTLLECFIARFNLGDDQHASEYGLGDCYAFVAKTLIMQASRVMPSIHSNRIAFATVMMAGTLLYYHWEAMLISYLSVRKTHLPLRSVEDLDKRSEYKVHCRSLRYLMGVGRKFYIPFHLNLFFVYYAIFTGGNSARHVVY